MVMAKHTITPVSAKTQGRWSEFCAAMSAAAKPFTDDDVFAIGSDRAYELDGVDAEIDAAIDRVRNTLGKPGERPDVAHSFVLRSGALHHKLSWPE